MPEVAQFHHTIQICVSFIGAILLMAIWFNIRKRFKDLLEEEETNKRIDKGLLYLSMAMMTWVFSGCWSLWLDGGDQTQLYDIGISIFSLFNNLFLMLALFYFYHAPSFIYGQRTTIMRVLILFVVAAVATLALSNYYPSIHVGSGIYLSALPDLIVSGFLSFLLIVTFYRTFSSRGLHLVAIISVISVLLMFVSQLPLVLRHLDNVFLNSLIKLVAKSSFIAISLVLATTWVIRLAHKPKQKEMAARFSDWGLVTLTIPSKGIYDRTVDFGAKATQYKNLLMFAIRRKLNSGDDQYVEVGNGGEIKSQTYLSRIIENMNDILELDPSDNLDRRDLFTFVGQGKYRLRMMADHITIDETLLKEFEQSSS